jgi:hypothetical protein
MYVPLGHLSARSFTSLVLASLVCVHYCCLNCIQCLEQIVRKNGVEELLVANELHNFMHYEHIPFIYISGCLVSLEVKGIILFFFILNLFKSLCKIFEFQIGKCFLVVNGIFQVSGRIIIFNFSQACHIVSDYNDCLLRRLSFSCSSLQNVTIAFTS